MPDLRPHEIVHLDLAEGLPEEPLGRSGRPLFLVLWRSGELVGYTEAPPGLPPAALATHVAEALVWPVGERLRGHGFPPAPLPDDDRPLPAAEVLRNVDAPLASLDEPVPAPPTLAISLAICTRDRPADLERCLRALEAASPAPDEVVVVDNAPRLGAAREVVESFPGVRYVAEERPGLSAARNAAVRAFSGDALAFIDDDCVVHPGWLRPLLAAFTADDVMAVTGLVLPAELESEAQAVFEFGFGGLGKGLQPARYDGAFLRATHAHGTPVWQIGAGANMAVRRAAFDLVGDFDERLGAGTSGCSEDSEFWYRLLAHGWACHYEPRSVVFHHHRPGRDALSGMVRDYIRGHVAALFVQFARHRHTGNLRRAFLGLPRHYARRGARQAARAAAARAGMIGPRGVSTLGDEVRGYARGLAYAPLALRPERPRHKAARWPFLQHNPFPDPYTLGFFYREKMRAIHRIAPDLPAARVLEVGGGQSGMARLLYPGAHVTCVDIDPALAEASVNLDPRVRFMTADATDLPFEDDSFDVVTLFDVLEHIPDDARAASEALRVTRPGGFVLVTTPGAHWRYPHFRALAPICPREEELFEEWGHVRRGYTGRDLVGLFGLTPVRTTGFITRPTALGHDLAWSNLPVRVKRALCAAVNPLTWAGYALQPADRPGSEIAASWRKPDLPLAGAGAAAESAGAGVRAGG